LLQSTDYQYAVFHYGCGTVFKVNTDGTGFTNLHNFNSSGSEGAEPHAGLVLSGNILYGTTEFGGSYAYGGVGYGTVFKINADGSDFTNLYSFSGGSDGHQPCASLALSGNTLFGTTVLGGTSGGYGTVFRIITDGTGFTNLYSFTANSGAPYYTNTDGSNPEAGLMMSGNILYGTTTTGGSGTNGTVFRVNTDGTSYTNLHNFTAGEVGSDYYGDLVLSGNTLYGTTIYGGTHGAGTVFALTLSPATIPLNIQSIGNAVVLSWSDPTFSLQAAPGVTGAYTNVSDATSPYTNATTDLQGFFRLKAN
jgi:uncharacterized repeat protein (TIGR03803 family)